MEGIGLECAKRVSVVTGNVLTMDKVLTHRNFRQVTQIHLPDVILEFTDRLTSLDVFHDVFDKAKRILVVAVDVRQLVALV